MRGLGDLYCGIVFTRAPSSFSWRQSGWSGQSVDYSRDFEIWRGRVAKMLAFRNLPVINEQLRSSGPIWMRLRVRLLFGRLWQSAACVSGNKTTLRPEACFYAANWPDLIPLLPQFCKIFAKLPFLLLASMPVYYSCQGSI